MSRVVVISPGHGRGTDGQFRRPLMTLKPDGTVVQIMRPSRHKRNANYRYYQEDMGTLAIAKEVTNALFWHDLDGPVSVPQKYKILLTRIDEQNAARHLRNIALFPQEWGSIRCVREITKKNHADALIEIHTNALDKYRAGSANGIAAHYAGPGGEHLANGIVNAVSEATGLRIRRVLENKSYGVLKGLGDTPRCIIEAGFHDHSGDLAYLIQPKNLVIIGQAIASGIVNNFKGGMK